jgi:hypothetical protein
VQPRQLGRSHQPQFSLVRSSPGLRLRLRLSLLQGSKKPSGLTAGSLPDARRSNARNPKTGRLMLSGSLSLQQNPCPSKVSFAPITVHPDNRSSRLSRRTSPIKISLSARTGLPRRRQPVCDLRVIQSKISLAMSPRTIPIDRGRAPVKWSSSGSISRNSRV